MQRNVAIIRNSESVCKHWFPSAMNTEFWLSLYKQKEYGTRQFMAVSAQSFDEE